MVGRAIKDVIDQKGFKQKVVAEKAGFDYSTLNMILNGHRKVQLEEFFILCRVLDVDPVFLYHKSQEGR